MLCTRAPQTCLYNIAYYPIHLLDNPIFISYTCIYVLAVPSAPSNMVDQDEQTAPRPVDDSRPKLPSFSDTGAVDGDPPPIFKGGEARMSLSSYAPSTSALSPVSPVSPVSPYCPFPPLMNLYAVEGFSKEALTTARLYGKEATDHLYTLKAHNTYHARGPLETRPGLDLHNGTNMKDPILATVGDEYSVLSHTVLPQLLYCHSFTSSARQPGRKKRIDGYGDTAGWYDCRQMYCLSLLY